MNTEMLERIAKEVRAFPGRFNMGDWFYLPEEVDEDEEVVDSADINECGTVCCIAGWAINVHLLDNSNGCVTMNDVDKFVLRHDMGYQGAGAAILGLEDREADELFYVAQWPLWARAHYLKVDEEQQAEFVAKLLELMAKLDDLSAAWDELYNVTVIEQDASAETA